MVFDLESNTIFYQEAAQIMKETIEYLELVGSKSASAVLAGGEPYIEDGSGENIVFVNPRHVYYGAGIYNSDESFKETVTVNRQAKIISFNWSLDNFIGINEPERTNHILKDGQYRIHLTKEYDPGKLSSQYWNDPVGRATICNTGSTILAIFDLVIGFFPTPDFTDLPAHFVVTPQTLYGFTRAYQSKDILKFITTFLGMITDNKEGFAAWLWQDALDDAGRAVARESAEEFMGIISNVNIVFKLLWFAMDPDHCFLICYGLHRK